MTTTYNTINPSKRFVRLSLLLLYSETGVSLTQIHRSFHFHTPFLAYNNIATMSDETDKKEETTTPKTEEEPKKEEEVEHEESTATFEPVVSTQNLGESDG